MHDGTLCSCSRFFQAAIKSDFREAHEKVVRLPEVDPDVFESFLEWVYTKSLKHIGNDFGDTTHDTNTTNVVNTTSNISNTSNTSPSSSSTTTTKGHDVDRHYEALFQQYFLGEKLQVRALKNAVIEETIHLEQRSNFVPCAEQVKQVFEGTVRGNQLRRLVVDMHLWDVEPSFMLEHEVWFDKEFFIDLALASIAFREKPVQVHPPYIRDPSTYWEVK